MLCHTTSNLPPNCSKSSIFHTLTCTSESCSWRATKECEVIWMYNWPVSEVSDFSRRMTSRIGNLIPIPNGIQIVALSARAMKCKYIVRKRQRRRRRFAVFYYFGLKQSTVTTHFEKLRTLKKIFKVRKIRRLVKAFISPILSFIRK